MDTIAVRPNAVNVREARTARYPAPLPEAVAPRMHRERGALLRRALGLLLVLVWPGPRRPLAGAPGRRGRGAQGSGCARDVRCTGRGKRSCTRFTKIRLKYTLARASPFPPSRHHHNPKAARRLRRLLSTSTYAAAAVESSLAPRAAWSPTPAAVRQRQLP